MTMYEKVRNLCKSKGLEISHLCQVLPDVKLSKSTISGWKCGAVPRAGTIKAIADYFGVTPEYLTNDDAPDISVATINAQQAVVGSPHSPVTIINGTEKGLSEQEIALLNLFGGLDVIGQARLLAFASDLRKEGGVR